MNRTVAAITLRQLVSRRRTILLLLLGAILVLVAFAIRISVNEEDLDRFAAQLLSNFGVATLMPLVALLLGTSTIGSELDDGTAVYLLAKPVSRWTILLTKLALAAGVSIVLTCVPIFLAGLIAAGGLANGLVLGFTLAAGFGAVVYCAIFVALSLVTSRALVFGLAYVLIWEGLLSGLFAGTRTFSVRQQTLALADAMADVPSRVFEAQLDLVTALVVGGVVLIGAFVFAGRRLVRIEIAGEST